MPKSCGGNGGYIQFTLCFLQCIKVNRQAELQTVAVLQKVRDEDLHKCKEDVMFVMSCDVI